MLGARLTVFLVFNRCCRVERRCWKQIAFFTARNRNALDPGLKLHTRTAKLSSRSRRAFTISKTNGPSFIKRWRKFTSAPETWAQLYAVWKKGQPKRATMEIFRERRVFG